MEASRTEDGAQAASSIDERAGELDGALEPVLAEVGIEAAADAPEGDEKSVLRAELEEAIDRQMRLAAEFENYRKRTIKESETTWSKAQADLATRLLEILDDFERVVALDQEKSSVTDVVQGVEMVQRKLLKELEGGGLERIGAPDEVFDPNVHEAIGSVPAESAEEDQTVGVVLQTGYSFGGTLLRPAKVQVKMWQGEAE